VKSLFAAYLMASALVAGGAPAPDPCADPALAAKAASAQSLAKQRKFVEAETPAREVLAVCATQPVGIAALGESLVGQKRYDEAITSLSAALGLKADLPHAYLWRGYAYYYKKQPDRMVGDFEIFVKLAPTAPEAAAVKQQLAALKR
jgi:tetratricopeptide (TPR) repeat protein